MGRHNDDDCLGMIHNVIYNKDSCLCYNYCEIGPSARPYHINNTYGVVQPTYLSAGLKGGGGIHSDISLLNG